MSAARIDGAQLLRGLDHLAREGDDLGALARRLGLDLDDERRRIQAIGSSPLTAFLPETTGDRYDHEWARRSLLVCLALRQARRRGSALSIPRDAEISARGLVIVPGDAAIDGRLWVRGTLIILGDLVVDSLEDEVSSQTIVVGDLHARSHVISDGFLGVLGRAKAPYLHLGCTAQHTLLLGGCASALLVDEANGKTAIAGSDDGEADPDGRPAALSSVLESRLLAPALDAARGGVRALGGELSRVLRGGRGILRPTVVADFVARVSAEGAGEASERSTTTGPVAPPTPTSTPPQPAPEPRPTSAAPRRRAAGDGSATRPRRAAKGESAGDLSESRPRRRAAKGVRDGEASETPPRQRAAKHAESSETPPRRRGAATEEPGDGSQPTSRRRVKREGAGESRGTEPRRASAAGGAPGEGNPRSSPRRRAASPAQADDAERGARPRSRGSKAESADG